MSELMGKVAMRGMGIDIDKMRCELSAASEERDFFKEKYITQIDEIKALQKDLRTSKNEIMRLREELVNMEMLRRMEINENASCQPTKTNVSDTTHSTCSMGDSDEESPETNLEVTCVEGEQKDDNIAPAEEEEVPVAEKEEEAEEEDGDDDDDEESNDSNPNTIRDRAAKMLIWANYQEARGRVGSSSNLTSPESSIRTPSQTAGAASRSVSMSSLPAQIPETIHATSSGKSSREQLPESVRHLLDLDDESSIEEDGIESEYESDEE